MPDLLLRLTGRIVKGCRWMIRGDPISGAPRYCHAMDDAGRVLSRAEELAQGFLAGLGSRPVWPRATFEEMLAAFDGPLPESGADPVAVVEELARTADAGLAGTAGPRFFGFVIGGSMPAALGADVLTSDLGPERRHQPADARRGRRRGRGRPLGGRGPGPARRLGRRLGDRRDDGQLHVPLRRPARSPGPGRVGRRRSRAVRGAAGAGRRGAVPPRHHRPRGALPRPRPGVGRRGRHRRRGPDLRRRRSSRPWPRVTDP